MLVGRTGVELGSEEFGKLKNQNFGFVLSPCVFVVKTASLLILFGLQLQGGKAAIAQNSVSNLGTKPTAKEPIPLMREFFDQSGPGHRFGTAISDSGDELYYAVAFNDGGRFREEIRFTRFEAGKWTKPLPLLDEKKFKYVDPHLSPDGQRLYFIYTRPVGSSRGGRNAPFDIWYLNRKGDGWSEPVNIGMPISAPDANDYFVSLTSERSLYFGSNREEANNFDLFCSKVGADGRYLQPERLRGDVNTDHYEADVFVSPDESYLIFSSNGRADGIGDGDLYVSFRSEDGSWSRGINMGKAINSSGNDFAPSVSRDGKYLFYSRGGTIHWIAAGVIGDLRSKL